MNVFLLLLALCRTEPATSTLASPVSYVVPVATATLPMLPPPAKATTAMSTTTSAPFTVAGDNAPIIQAFLDSLPDGAAVTLPPGLWITNSILMVRKPVTIRTEANWPATLRIVAKDHPNLDILRCRSATDGPVHNVTLEGIIFDASGATGSGIHNCVDAYGDDFTMRRCKLLNSHHEGITASGHRALIEDCEAQNCGNGSKWYGPRSTAAFNCYNAQLVYRRVKTRKCGQGIEVGRFDAVVEDCVVEEPGPGTPSIGINIGSDVFGVNNLLVQRCTVKGYRQGVQCGNGVGRLANVRIVDCRFDDAPVSLEGGMPDNKATDPAYPPGPDTGTSVVKRCVFVVGRTSGGALAINTGPTDMGAVHPRGREKWHWLDNTIYAAPGVDVTNNCPLVILGNQTGDVEIKRNKLFGYDTTPAWGHIATLSSNANRAVKGQPGLVLEENRVFGTDGKERKLVVKVEGK